MQWPRPPKRIIPLACVALGLGAAAPAAAGPIPAGWTCAGGSVCGTAGPDGVVSAPPGGTTYAYVTTAGASGQNGAALIPNTGNGSVLLTHPFTLGPGQTFSVPLAFLTSDGGLYQDYAWAALIDLATDARTWLFTARTTRTDAPVPGEGLPAISPGVSLGPVGFTAGAPTWSPLGGSSGACFTIPGLEEVWLGCGWTDWITVSWRVPPGQGGLYRAAFAVANFRDEGWQSGLALGVPTVDGQPIEPPAPVPEPASAALLALALLGIGLARRRVG